MAWGKKKQIEDNYFARVEDSQLDFDNPLIQEIAERVNSQLFMTWPNIRLNDLQSILGSIAQDIARASDRDVRVGTITYFEKNQKGKDEPTGLSWEDAVITASFENIVVSTSDHIFNSPAVRQDEASDYGTIIDSLNSLIDVALANTDLSNADMPVFPSEDEYREARETDGVLTIEASKFNFNQVSKTTENESDSGKVAEPQDSVQSPPSETNTMQPKVENTLPTIDQTPSNDPTEGRDIFAKSRVLIDQVSLETLSLPLADVNTGLPAEATDYVQSMLNADRTKANNFLLETSQMYAQQIRKSLADELKKAQSELSLDVEQLRNTDVAATIKDQFAEERPKEFDDRYELAEKARKAGFQAEIKAENLRHETAIDALKNDYYRDLEELKVSINKELDDWYLNRTGTLIQNMTDSVNQEIQAKTDDKISTTLTALTSLRDELLAQHSESLIALQDQLSEDIEHKRGNYHKEHEEALLQATKLETAKTQSSHLDQLEKQIIVLKNHNGDLEDKLKASDTQQVEKVTKLKQENATLTELLKQVRQNDEQSSSSSVNQSSDLNQQIMTLLAQQLQERQANGDDHNKDKKPKSGVSAFLIGAVSALVIGGTAFSAYTLGHQSSASQQARTQKTSASTSQTSTVLKADETQDQSSSVASSSSNSSSSTTAASSQAVNPLASQYHVGENVKATINGKEVTAQVNSIEDQAITITYGGQTYNVPMTN